jgi:hypothetical protein
MGETAKILPTCVACCCNWRVHVHGVYACSLPSTIYVRLSASASQNGRVNFGRAHSLQSQNLCPRLSRNQGRPSGFDVTLKRII